MTVKLAPSYAYKRHKDYDKNTKNIYSDKAFYKAMDDDLLPLLKKAAGDSQISYSTMGEADFESLPSNGRNIRKGRAKVGKESYTHLASGACACHGRLRNTTNYKAKVVMTKMDMALINKRFESGERSSLINQTACEEYFDFLFKESPWRDAYLTKTGKEVFEKGYILCRTDVPSNVLLAACIASRRVFQYCTSLFNLMFYLERKLKRARLEKTPSQIRRMAFFMTLCVGVTHSYRKGLGFETDSSDSVLIKLKYISWQGLKAFVIDGKPYAQLNPIYSSNPAYSRVASMWHKSPETPIWTYLKRQAEVPGNKIRVPQEFGGSTPYYILSEFEILAICLDLFSELDER